MSHGKVDAAVKKPWTQACKGLELNDLEGSLSKHRSGCDENSESETVAIVTLRKCILTQRVLKFADIIGEQSSKVMEGTEDGKIVLHFVNSR